MSVFHADLETSIKITGYTFESLIPLEGVDNVTTAIGYRNRDELPVVAKLSHQALRLEREFHTVQRLYRQESGRSRLCKPLERVSLTNSYSAFIYEHYGKNRLDLCQPVLTHSPDFQAATQPTTPSPPAESYSPPEEQQQQQQRTLLSLEDFLDFAIQCCNCLELIHTNQIVHGEIKLNAFLWPEQSSVKIWNFGSGPRGLEMSLTSEGWRKIVQRHGANHFLQMLVYMSPEQTGRTTFQPDHRTDLYSLGITFYVALTSSLPFEHSSPMETIHSVLNRKLPLVHKERPDLPTILSMIIEKLTNKSPDERYSSAHGLREDLKECQKQLELNKSISPFRLGRFDIASVFTLPSNGCFGRTRELNLINSIIRRTAYLCGYETRQANSTALTTVDDTYKRVVNGTNKKNRIYNTKRPIEIIAIYGNTGVGKTTLVRNAQQFAREYGYIAIAKFDTRQPTPYGCLLRCLSIFFRNILSEPQSEIERFSKMLREHLGAETLSQLPILLVDNVPELSAFLDERKSMQKLNQSEQLGCECDMEGGEIKLRFHSAFIEIFQVMVKFKFVTLFLEDLHQADEASIELLDSLFSAKLQFLVILTYRDCLLKYKLLNNEDAVVSYIHIKNLDEDALVELIRTTMHRLEEIDTVILTPLVDFIYQRTRGNPFYACQLLMALEKKNLIYFTWEKARWEYNLHEIEKVLLVDLKEESSTVDKDIEFVKSRFKDLPRDGRKFLKWASFIGNTFDYETVRHVMLANGEKWDTLNGLQSVIQQGFIQTFNEEFRFTHDRYSQAAMLLDPEEPDDIYHLTIATYFIHRATDMFWVADHIKAALHLVQKNEIKGDYRKVCLKAGDKAFDSGAHKLAFSYYSAAEKLLDTPNAWKDGVDSKYTETLHIYTRLAEISWFMDYSKTREYLALILKHARSTVDRAAAYRVQHRYRWSRTGNHESALILLECLSELGVCDIELTLSKEELRKVYEATRTQVLKVGWENILQLPVCEDRLVRTRFAILEEVCLWAYWTLDMSAMLSVGARLITKTLTFGTTPSTGVGFVFFGIAAMKLFKVFEFSEQISKIGVDLCDCHGGNSESGRARYLYSNFFNSWKNSYHDSIPLSRLAMKQCLLGGDRIYATFAHLHIVMGNLLCGQNMSYTLREAKTCLEETETFNDSTGAIILATTVIRVILAMQGKTFLTEDALFDDKEFTERAFIQEAQMEPVNTTSQLYYYYAMKSVVLSMYRMDKASIQISADHIHQAETIPSARHTHLLFFFRCISLIRLSRETNVDYMESILDCKSKLEEWAEHSHPDNLTMFISAIDAELASLDSQDLKAQQLYDLAIEQAKNGKWPMESCMMYELAGDYFLRNRFSSFGCTLIEKAISGYRHLGVYGRVNQLTQLYKQVLNKSAFSDQHRDISVQTEPIPSLSKRDSIGDFALSEPESDNQHHQQQQESPEETLLSLDVVDLASIIKSSQVISSEMNFDLLLKQMMGIILENSGAESGVIIVKENTSFLIVAGGSQTDGCEIYHTPKKLQDEADSIVTRISQYAIHSQETLFIVDVKQDSRFSDCTTQAKSCLCTPIIHKSAIVGCIYIEGAIGTLTSRHKTVLQLLSQQIGISVTNALLFKSIQKVTYANVRMIENQKAALEEARKSKEAALHAMKLKSDFLANMSHELRTPFSGFYGMISLLSETTLDAEQLDIVHTAKESCEMLLKIIDDLLNFSKLEAGKVTLDLGPLVVEEVIADTIEILSSLAARKGLELAYIVDQDVPTTIIGDSSRLRQILTNLLGNAIKFTHEGGVVIKCHLDEELDSNFVRLKFEVVDTGIGIREEQQRHLFEPFSQVDGSTTRMYGGTGLGLSICLQLVRLMMGEVGVESDMEWGSNFWFTIAVSKQNQGNKRTSLGLLRNQSVLLAAENDVNATMMYSLLSDFAMRHTKDMQQAVSQALQEHYDILILDIPAKPTPSIAHQLQSVDDDPECELHIVLLYTPSTEGHKLAAEATNSASERRGRLVKVAKPVRRVKLLRLLEQVLDTAPLPSIQPVLGNRMTDHFKKDELAWFYQKPVLIAEDNMVAQKLLKKQLEKMGFIVESANNGEEAVQLWQERPRNYFCLGFFDHHMPKCDGVEATKRIRKLESGTHNRLPIVALTADIQITARDICVEAGMDGYLTKPLIPKDLAYTLRSLNPAIQKHYDTPASSTPSSPAFN